MQKINLRQNKLFVAGATAFFSGALSLLLDKLQYKSIFIILLGYTIITFLYIIATLRLSLSQSLIIALLTSIIVYKFSVDAAINILEMAFLGSFSAEFVKKDVNPNIAIPFISIVLTFLGIVEIKFGNDKTYNILITTLGPYLFGFLFLVSTLVTYVTYYLSAIYIKRNDDIFLKAFYPRSLSVITIVIFLLVFFTKKFFILNTFLINLILILISLLLIEGLNFSILLIRKTDSTFFRIVFFVFFLVLPYLFSIIGFINNLLSLHQKFIVGGKEK